MALYIKCEFPLPGAERVALVWDGKKRFIECTSGNYEGSFDVHFGNEKSILVHVRILPMTFTLLLLQV